MKKLSLRGCHLSDYAESYLDQITQREYHDHMKGCEILYRAFVENPDLPVEIVAGPDSICKEAGAEECLFFGPDCKMNGFRTEEDQRTLGEYDLEAGKVYSASDLVKRFIEFRNRTGYLSPRLRFEHEGNAGGEAR